jgi:hypothetical protein
VNRTSALQARLTVLLSTAPEDSMPRLQSEKNTVQKMDSQIARRGFKRCCKLPVSHTGDVRFLCAQTNHL